MSGDLFVPKLPEPIRPGQPYPTVDDPDSRSLPAAPTAPVSADDLDVERRLFGHTQDA